MLWPIKRVVTLIKKKFNIGNSPSIPSHVLPVFNKKN